MFIRSYTAVFLEVFLKSVLDFLFLTYELMTLEIKKIAYPFSLRKRTLIYNDDVMSTIYNDNNHLLLW